MSLATLFNSALRQSNSIKKDLAALSDAQTETSGSATLSSTAALQGQLSASLTSFSRTVDEYDSLAKQELVQDKQEKALSRVKNFRAELVDFREQYAKLKKEREEALSQSNRNELFGRRPHNGNTPENPYANAANIAAQQGPFRPSASSLGAPPSDYTRETHAFREQSFMEQTNASLDEFLDRGRAVLGNLGEQREMLKNTQKRLYGVANTLGISGDTIRMIERRAKQDKWIFWGGVIGFFTFCYLVLRFLR